MEADPIEVDASAGHAIQGDTVQLNALQDGAMQACASMCRHCAKQKHATADSNQGCNIP
jgi:hypothetical protein